MKKYLHLFLTLLITNSLALAMENNNNNDNDSQENYVFINLLDCPNNISIGETKTSDLQQLIDAIQEKNAGLVKTIIKQNKELINQTDLSIYKMTPLHIAARSYAFFNGSKALNIIQILLDNGADKNIQSVLGKTPYDIMSLMSNNDHSLDKNQCDNILQSLKPDQ